MGSSKERKQSFWVCSSVVERCPDKTEVDGSIPSTPTKSNPNFTAGRNNNEEMKKYINWFWRWYEGNLRLNIGIAAGIFVWQLIHLFWLTLDVVTARLFSVALFHITGVLQYAIIAVDYAEMPAIITVSLVYINELRKGKDVKRNILFLVLLNSQWLHLFWITDEFVLEILRGGGAVLPLWLAWIAILIDYLELPVIYDTIRKLLKSRG